MSLFEELSKREINKTPKETNNYKKILKEKNNKEDVKTRRELCAEKKAELSEEEYKRWLNSEYYKKNKAYKKEEYNRKKEEKDKLIEEIYTEIYDILPDPINLDEYYTEKYRSDDVNYDGVFKFSWWASRLNWVKPSKEERYDKPIRVYKPWGFKLMFSKLGNMQDKAYEYMKQHINEVTLKDFRLSKKQWLTKNPMWAANWRMRELIDEPSISDNQICSVASAMLRDKYIVNELYMGRISFLVGDIIITQAGNVIRPCLENNIPWLTPDTVDELHKKRMDWLKKKTDDLKIYMLRDCYLLKEQPNERETLFYFTPT